MLGTLVLVRDTFTDKEVMGKFIIPVGNRFDLNGQIDGEIICQTIERPWRNNTPRESCIPEGKYTLQLRFSPMVKKSTGGKYDEGYEITNVPERSYIMIHPANRAIELLGCIAPGESRGKLNGENAVLNSRKAFDKLMERLEERNDWEILITRVPMVK